MNLKKFIETVWVYYHDHKRSLPWRETTDPYKILVSEIMLQQTQVNRVAETYVKFINVIPNFSKLAITPLVDVLRLWQGLGYNRRALYLQQTAELIMNKYGGKMPEEPAKLQQFPGIGSNTAGAICTYVFNKPFVFVETNIRSVFLHHFFSGKSEIHDRELVPLIQKTVDRRNPREWYWALMDYGSFLKKTGQNPNRKSFHYIKQTKFAGSVREARGLIVKTLIKHPSLTENSLSIIIKRDDLTALLDNLIKDQLLTKTGRKYMIRQKP
jgi:A/G-specific adenine glycosylase